MDSRMQDSHKSFLIKDLLGDVLRPGAAGAAGVVAAVGMSVNYSLFFFYVGRKTKTTLSLYCKNARSFMMWPFTAQGAVRVKHENKKYNIT